VAIGFYRFFSEELGRLGYVEGENLMVERYSGEGWTERYADLARDVVSTHPDLISAPRDVPVMHSTIPVDIRWFVLTSSKQF
jgi:hypothetical protein